MNGIKSGLTTYSKGVWMAVFAHAYVHSKNDKKFSFNINIAENAATKTLTMKTFCQNNSVLCWRTV